MATTALTQGIHHLGLSVLDLEASKRFFTEVLQFQLVREVPAYPAAFVSDGSIMLTLWQVSEPETATAFDRKTVVGLHHFALGVESPERLNDVHDRLLRAEGVEIEFGPEAMGPGPSQHLMCRIPGGIRMEVIAAVK